MPPSHTAPATEEPDAANSTDAENVPRVPPSSASHTVVGVAALSQTASKAPGINCSVLHMEVGKDASRKDAPSPQWAARIYVPHMGAVNGANTKDVTNPLNHALTIVSNMEVVGLASFEDATRSPEAKQNSVQRMEVACVVE
mmetsp:Transcript_23638/g.39408  ORF Transcript_23638/g.39408 Transcript_23638/m.39408 type:complete len:142 (+) Transcript_23638:520-945(+)